MSMDGRSRWRSRCAGAVSALLLFTASLSIAQSWTRLPRTFASLSDIRFIDTNRGYVIATSPARERDTLFYTSNGGYDWSRVALPAGALYRVDLCADTAWVACSLDTTAAGGQCKLIAVLDGVCNRYVGFADRRFVYDVHFRDRNLGYALFRCDTNPSASEYFHDSLLVTTDAGQSWSLRDVVLGGVYEVLTGYGTGVVKCMRPAGGSAYQETIDSYDSGSSFAIGTPFDNSFLYIGDQQWIADRSISTDDGRTWNAWGGDGDGNAYKYWADTIGDIYSRMSSFDSLQITHDRGIHWQSALFTTGRSPYRMTVLDHNNAYAIDGAALYKTSTGGVAGVEPIHQMDGARLIVDPVKHRIQIPLPDLHPIMYDVLGRVVDVAVQYDASSAYVSYADLPHGFYCVVAGQLSLQFTH